MKDFSFDDIALDMNTTEHNCSDSLMATVSATTNSVEPTTLVAPTTFVQSGESISSPTKPTIQPKTDVLTTESAGTDSSGLKNFA